MNWADAKSILAVDSTEEINWAAAESFLLIVALLARGKGDAQPDPQVDAVRAAFRQRDIERAKSRRQLKLALAGCVASAAVIVCLVLQLN